MLSQRYHLLTRLGEGGMASVWLAHDARLDVRRAVKILDPALGKNQRLRSRFEAEARAMARLQHPHVVMIHDVAEDGDLAYIVMELVHGGSLVEKVRTRGPMAPRNACELMAQVLDALDAAHAAGIVHRDVKPHNILLTAEGIPKLTDFGIAQIQSSAQHLTRTGSVMGTIPYMAPEQKLDSKGVGPAADVYGAGATLYHLLTGTEPYDLYVDQVRVQVLQNLYDAIAVIIDRATRYDPADRYHTAGEMRGALLGVIPRLPFPNAGISVWMGVAPNTEIAAPSVGDSTPAQPTVEYGATPGPIPPSADVDTLIRPERGPHDLPLAVGAAPRSVPPPPPAASDTVLRPPAPPAPPSASSWPPLVVGVGGMVLLAAGALALGLAIWPRSEGRVERPDPVPLATPGPVPAVPAPAPAPPPATPLPVPRPTPVPEPPKLVAPVSPSPPAAPTPTPPPPAPVPGPEPVVQPAPEPSPTPEPPAPTEPVVPAPGVAVKVRALPRGTTARLSIDGAPAGGTPWTGTLTPGSHRVTLEAADGGSHTWNQAFREGTPAELCWDFAANQICPK